MKLLYNDIFVTEATYGIGVKLFAALTGVSSYSILGQDSKPTLSFYKGTIPAASEMNGFLSSSRSSDLLLQFSNVSTPITRTNKTVTFNYGPTVFGSVFQAGTIAWFCTGTTYLAGAAPANSMPLLFGTVGLTGSGADLELPKVAVATGDLWLCTNMNFDLGNELTYS